MITNFQFLAVEKNGTSEALPIILASTEEQARDILLEQYGYEFVLVPVS